MTRKDVRAALMDRGSYRVDRHKLRIETRQIRGLCCVIAHSPKHRERVVLGAGSTWAQAYCRALANAGSSLSAARVMA